MTNQEKEALRDLYDVVTGAVEYVGSVLLPTRWQAAMVAVSRAFNAFESGKYSDIKQDIDAICERIGG